MSTTRQITLTEHADGKWTAYDTATETVTQGNSRDEALAKLDDAANSGAEDRDSPADRVGGRGLFTGDEGEAFAAAVEQSREEFDQDYNKKQDDLFGQ